MLSLLIIFLGGLRVVAAENSTVNDAASNLFRDIAPLVALFGGQVARPFLGQSLSLLENLIFACAPFGIIAAVACAIRIGRPSGLRALIGRSREPAIQAELELLRSTSKDICELWDGRQLVRVAGSPEILELLFDNDGITYRRNEVMEGRPQSSFWSRVFPAKRQRGDSELLDLELPITQNQVAPNIFLNCGGLGGGQVLLVALIAVVLQIVVLLYDCLISFPGLGPGLRPLTNFPLTAGGIVAVSVGMFACAFVVEARTRRVLWIPRDRTKNLRIMWIQKSQILNNQRFGSCAIFAERSRRKLVTSQADPRKNLGLLATFGSCITAVGFIAQLLGLRTIHYSAAVAQFIATIFLTMLRIVMHRSYNRSPVVKRLNQLPRSSHDRLDLDPTEPINTFGVVELPEGEELNEISKQVSGCKEWAVCSASYFLGVDDLQEETDISSMARKVLRNRMDLEDVYVNFWSPRTTTITDTLRETMEAVLNYMWINQPQTSGAAENTEQLSWDISVITKGSKVSLTKLSIQLSRCDDTWQLEQDILESVLEMWLSQLRANGIPNESDNLWLLACENNQSDIWQVLLDFLHPGHPELIRVVDIGQTCEQRHIHLRRILSSDGSRSPRSGQPIRALINHTDLQTMCSHYLIATFLSQMFSISEIPVRGLFLSNDPESTAFLIHDPLVERVTKFLQESGIANTADSFTLVLSALGQAGKLPDPLMILPDILSSAVRQGKGDRATTCDRIRQLFNHKIKKLESEDMTVEAAELCLGMTGEFVEFFGHNSQETRKLRELVRQVNGAAERTGHLSWRSLRRPSLNQIPKLRIRGNGHFFVNSDVPDRQTLSESQDRSDANGNEQHLKSFAVAGDVENVRQCLLYVQHNAQSLLYECLLAAFDAAKEECTIPRTEILRLLVLSGSGVETDRFCISDLLDLAACCGNVKFAELLLKRGRRKLADLKEGAALGTAIEFGQEDVVRTLLDSGVDPDSCENDGLTPLHLAVLHRQDAIVRLLLDVGADIQSQTKQGSTALTLAAESGHEALGRFLIEIELNASVKNTAGVGYYYHDSETSLHLVAAKGNLNLVLALLDAGWDINGGKCPHSPLYSAISHRQEHIAIHLIDKGARIDLGLLHSAARHGLTATARLLLSHGADVNALDDSEATPLVIAAEYGNEPIGYVQFVKLLVGSGANVDARDREGRMALLVAAERGHEIVSIMLAQYGEVLNEKRADGTTAMHSAAKHGLLRLLSKLISKGVDVDTADENGETPLHFAAKNGHTEAIRALAGAKLGDWVNAESKHPSGYTALHYTVDLSHAEAARALIESGARMTTSTLRPNSPLEMAVRGDRAEMVQLFMDMGATLEVRWGETKSRLAELAVECHTPETIKALFSKDSAGASDRKPSQATLLLPLAASCGRLDVVTLLLELGADVSNCSALSEAARKGYADIAKLLFAQNRDASLTLGTQILLSAAEADDAPIVKFWLDVGVPIDVKDSRGETALHRAASSGAFNTLSVLIEANSTPSFINARARSGATALYVAARDGSKDNPLAHLDIVKELVKHGADRSIRALPDWSFEREQKPRGFTPLDAARSQMILPIVEYLEDFGDETISSASSLPRRSTDDGR